MTALGQTQPKRAFRTISGTRGTDTAGPTRLFRFVPKSEVAASFDHLVGDGGHRWRNIEAERLRGLEMDDQLEFSRLHHRQVGGLGAFESLAGINAGR
jgi:hypothetical protein